MAKMAARSARAAFANEMQGEDRRPSERGLREGDTRMSCVVRKDQAQVLHDWARTAGKSFREVCVTMIDRYVAEVIERAHEDGIELRCHAV